MNHQKLLSAFSNVKNNLRTIYKSSFKSKVILFAGVAVVVLVGFIFLSRVKSAPDDVSLSTISPNSFTVSFFTDWKAKPVLVVADNPDFKNTIEFNDERDYYANDTKDKRKGRNSHVFVARNLDPETQYWFRVKTFMHNDYDKEFYTVKTPELSNYVPTPDPVFGQVFNQKGGPQGNILIEIYAQRDDGERSSSIITYTDSDSGTYSHDLSNLRKRDASEYWDFNKQEYPNKLVITAMSNNERYAYEVYDLDNVSPVRTFEFREVDEDYATLPFFKPALAQDSRQGQPCGNGRYYSEKGNCLSLCTSEVNKTPPSCYHVSDGSGTCVVNSGENSDNREFICRSRGAAPPSSPEQPQETSNAGQPCGDVKYYSDKGNCLSLCTSEVNKNPPGCSQTNSGNGTCVVNSGENSDNREFTCRNRASSPPAPEQHKPSSNAGQSCGGGKYYSDQGSCLPLCTPHVDTAPANCAVKPEGGGNCVVNSGGPGDNREFDCNQGGGGEQQPGENPPQESTLSQTCPEGQIWNGNTCVGSCPAAGGSARSCHCLGNLCVDGNNLVCNGGECVDNSCDSCLAKYHHTVNFMVKENGIDLETARCMGRNEARKSKGSCLTEPVCNGGEEVCQGATGKKVDEEIVCGEGKYKSEKGNCLPLCTSAVNAQPRCTYISMESVDNGNCVINSGNDQDNREFICSQIPADNLGREEINPTRCLYGKDSKYKCVPGKQGYAMPFNNECSSPTGSQYCREDGSCGDPKECIDEREAIKAPVTERVPVKYNCADEGEDKCLIITKYADGSQTHDKRSGVCTTYESETPITCKSQGEVDSVYDCRQDLISKGLDNVCFNENNQPSDLQQSKLQGMIYQCRNPQNGKLYQCCTEGTLNADKPSDAIACGTNFDESKASSVSCQDESGTCVIQLVDNNGNKKIYKNVSRARCNKEAVVAYENRSELKCVSTGETERRETIDCRERGGQIKFKNSDSTIEYICHDDMVSMKCKEPGLAITQRGDNFACISTARHPDCENFESMKNSCIEGTSKYNGRNSCRNPSDNKVYQCECEYRDGLCTSDLSVPYHDSSGSMYNDNNFRTCSTVFTTDPAGNLSVCTVSHCMRLDEHRFYGDEDVQRTVKPQGCNDPNAVIILTRDRFNVSYENSSDPAICTPLTQEEIQKISQCTSVVNTTPNSRVIVTNGTNLSVKSQSGQIVTCTVTSASYESNSEFNQRDAYSPSLVVECNTPLCSGDCGSGYYNEDGILVGVHNIGFGGDFEIQGEEAGASCGTRKLLQPVDYVDYIAKDITSPISHLIPRAKAEANDVPLVKSSFDLDAGKYTLNNGASIEVSNPTKITLYDDLNGNNIRDIGEPEVAAINPELNKVQDAYNYEVLNGWNAMNFPFYKTQEEFFRASELLAVARSQNLNMTTVKKWAGKWVEYSESDGKTFGNDFSIKPNEGYFVLNKNKGKLVVYGNTPKEPFPMQVYNGWSLVGVGAGNEQEPASFKNQAFNNGIGAFEFMKTFNTVDPELKLSNVTRYDSGVYRGVNYATGASGKKVEFGLDFKMMYYQAYFIKSEKKTVLFP